MIKTIITLLVFLSLSLGIGFTQDKKDDSKIKHTRVMKEVQGEISSVSKRSISIIYSRDENNGEENEIMIPLDKKKVQLDHIRSLSELAAGDIVRVQFEEEEIQGQGKDKINFQAKLISFVKKGQPKKVRAQATESNNLPVLDSN